MKAHELLSLSTLCSNTGQWRYSWVHSLACRWSWVVGFTLWAFLSLGKEIQYPLNRRPEGFHRRSVRSEEEKTTLVPADYRTTIRRLSRP